MSEPMHDFWIAEVDRLKAEVAALRERDALGRLEAWRRASRHHEPTISYIPEAGWKVRLSSDLPYVVHGYGWADSVPEAPDPTTVHCGDGATLAECILAALDLWRQRHGEG
jgi:hypothetical protein